MISKKLRNFAKGKECSLQIHPYCLGEHESVVACHIGKLSKGFGKKSTDLMMVHGCSVCHDIIDGRMRVDDLSRDDINVILIWALERTLTLLADEEIIVVK